MSRPSSTHTTSPRLLTRQPAHACRPNTRRRVWIPASVSILSVVSSSQLMRTRPGTRMIAAAPMGDANASIPTPQPAHFRQMFGALGGARAATCVSFVSQAGLDSGMAARLGLQKRLVAVKGTRTVRKKDLILNNYQPKIDVDSQTYQVRADGQLLICEPATVLPLAQRYFLF